MSFGNEARPFGLRDVKITKMDGSQQVDFPAAQTLSFNPRLTSGELMGDDSLVSVVAFIIGGDWSLEGGGLPMQALEVITGKTASLIGTSPNQTISLSLAAGDNMPYFKIYGKAMGEGMDDIHAKLFKVKCTAFEGGFQGENFLITKCSGVAVKDSSGQVIEWVQNETATDLPTS